MNGRPAPRPKRGGEAFARSHQADEERQRAAKKVRFDTRNPAALANDAPEDDAVLDADEIGRRGAQAKRSAVNIDGYESDSSNEGFDARANAKARQAKNVQNGGGGAAAAASKDEEDDDMFADVEENQFPDGDEDEDLAKTGKKRRDVRLVDVDEVVDGQAPESKSGGHIRADLLFHPDLEDRDAEVESESSDDDEEADMRRAAVDEDMDQELGAGSKKQHAPRLEAFNLKQEKEDGGFDEQQNYVRKAVDPDAVYDNWLQGTSKKDMKKAKEAHERRERERRAKDREDDEILTANVLRNLIPHLQPSESPMEALARLGRAKSKSAKKAKTPKWKAQKNKSAEMEVDAVEPDLGQSEEDPSEKSRRLAVEAITDSADRLMRRGQEEIYETEREVLIRMYTRDTGEEWQEEGDEDADQEGDVKQWEYRWADARDGGATHGPYDGQQMEAWNAAGYFGEGVEFRRAGVAEAEWSGAAQFL